MHTFTDPAILFFVFGLIAGCVRSNLEIPASIEGRSAKGQYFIVDSLMAYAVSK